MNSTQAYALSKKYTDETAIEFGGLKGAPCTIKSITKQDGQNIVVFEWKNSAGDTRESTMYVDDGTPIYVWESGHTYKYGDLAIYESCFYRCIVENSDVEFDDTKWNEIGSPDGNYDIVQNSSLLPPRFTAADRKMYYSIEDGFFWLWNGTEWESQKTVRQYDVMPTPSIPYENKVIQYIGNDTAEFKMGYFYRCMKDSNNQYYWLNINTSDVDELTSAQLTDLINILQ